MLKFAHRISSKSLEVLLLYFVYMFTNMTPISKQEQATLSDISSKYASFSIQNMLPECLNLRPTFNISIQLMLLYLRTYVFSNMTRILSSSTDNVNVCDKHLTVERAVLRQLFLNIVRNYSFEISQVSFTQFSHTSITRRPGFGHDGRFAPYL